MRRGPSSSAMLLSITVIMLGAVMLKFSGASHLAILLSVLVLGMGLASMVVLLLRSSRAEEAACDPPRDSTAAGVAHEPVEPVGPAEPPPSESTRIGRARGDARLRSLTQLLESFETWFSTRDDESPWPGFDRWIRDTLHELAGARRVRCFHVQDGERNQVGAVEPRLISLTDDLDDPAALRGAWRALIESVIESGQMFVRPACPEAESDLQASGEEMPHRPRWLLPIRIGGRTRGLLMAPEITSQDWQEDVLLEAAGGIIAACWHRVQQTVELGIALRTDRASGVLNRTDLTGQMTQVLAEAKREEEPVVLMALAIEGLRRLDDGKQWDLQDWLMKQVGQTLRRRLRSDDIVGRFSEDRFLVLMRRLDSSLGEIIARKVLAAVSQVIAQGDPALATSVQIRCGLAADAKPSRHGEAGSWAATSGAHESFESLLSRACDALQEARAQQRELACAPSVAAAGAGGVAAMSGAGAGP